MRNLKSFPPVKKLLRSITCFLVFTSLSGLTKAGLEDYYMAHAFELDEVSLEFNSFYNGLIRKKLKELNKSPLSKRRSCQTVVQKLRPVFGGLFKSKKVPLGVIDQFPTLDHFPKLKDPRFLNQVDEKGLYLGLEKASELKRVFNLGGVYVGTDKFAHFFELGGWYYDRYLKRLKRYKRRHSKEKADLMAKKDVVKWGFTLEGTITGKWSKMLSYGDMEANYQGFLFYHSLCHSKTPGLQKVKGDWALVHELDFKEWVSPFLDDSYSLGDYNKRKWKKVRPNLLKLCPILDEPTFQKRKERYSTDYPLSLNAKTIVDSLKKDDASPVFKFSLGSVCETDRSYEEGGFHSDLNITLPGKPSPSLTIKLKKKAKLIDDKTLNPENIEVHESGKLLSWTGGLLPLYRYFSQLNEDGTWSDPKEELLSFNKPSLTKKAFSLPIKASSTFVKGSYITGNEKDEVIVTSIMSIHQKRGAFYLFKKKSGQKYQFFKKLETKDLGIPGRYGLLKHQRFSKDGKWMTFYARGTKRGPGLYLYNFETKKSFLLSDHNDKHPTFNAKGDKIFFHYQLGGNSSKKSGYDFELSYLGYIKLNFKGPKGNQLTWERVLLDKPKKGFYNYQKHPVPYPGSDLVFSHGRAHPEKGGMKLYVRNMKNPEKKWVLKLSSVAKGIKLNRAKHPSSSFLKKGLYFVGRNKKEDNNRVYFLNQEVIDSIREKVQGL